MYSVAERLEPGWSAEAIHSNLELALGPGTSPL